MTEQDDEEQREIWNALGVRTDIPHPARVYDYMLGGKDNFAADRETAERTSTTTRWCSCTPRR
jgi:hypothetical protein